MLSVNARGVAGDERIQTPVVRHTRIAVEKIDSVRGGFVVSQMVAACIKYKDAHIDVGIRLISNDRFACSYELDAGSVAVAFVTLDQVALAARNEQPGSLVAAFVPQELVALADISLNSGSVLIRLICCQCIVRGNGSGSVCYQVNANGVVVGVHADHLRILNALEKDAAAAAVCGAARPQDDHVADGNRVDGGGISSYVEAIQAQRDMADCDEDRVRATGNWGGHDVVASYGNRRACADRGRRFRGAREQNDDRAEHYRNWASHVEVGEW
jgi:hypothetical protein